MIRDDDEKQQQYVVNDNNFGLNSENSLHSNTSDDSFLKMISDGNCNFERNVVQQAERFAVKSHDKRKKERKFLD